MFSLIVYYHCQYTVHPAFMHAVYGAALLIFHKLLYRAVQTISLNLFFTIL